jgi:hypothetical protein
MGSMLPMVTEQALIYSTNGHICKKVRPTGPVARGQLQSHLRPASPRLNRSCKTCHHNNLPPSLRQKQQAYLSLVGIFTNAQTPCSSRFPEVIMKARL